MVLSELTKTQLIDIPTEFQTLVYELGMSMYKARVSGPPNKELFNDCLNTAKNKFQRSLNEYFQRIQQPSVN
jgi:hypothetical protein